MQFRNERIDDTNGMAGSLHRVQKQLCVVDPANRAKNADKPPRDRGRAIFEGQPGEFIAIRAPQDDLRSQGLQGIKRSRDPEQAFLERNQAQAVGIDDRIRRQQRRRAAVEKH